MVDQELLQAISQMMDQKLEPISQRLDDVEKDLEEVKSVTKTLTQWSKKVSAAATAPLPDRLPLNKHK